MFEGSSVVSKIERPVWDATRVDSRVDWKRVDRELRAIASKRAALDAAEARWLREAARLQIWRPLGMVSAFDYMERVLGYTPHTARERLRVAKALAELPVIGESFGRGELSYSAVREITRVATANTDAQWRDFAVGKTVREIEDSVACHAPGRRPSDPADPTIRPTAHVPRNGHAHLMRPCRSSISSTYERARSRQRSVGQQRVGARFVIDHQTTHSLTLITQTRRALDPPKAGLAGPVWHGVGGGTSVVRGHRAERLGGERLIGDRRSTSSAPGSSRTGVDERVPRSARLG